MSNPYHALRLPPAADLRQALEDYLQTRAISAAALVTCVGSLRQANLRLAGAAQQTLLNGPLEIVSATGTLSVHGCHVHCSVADELGKVSGGHLLYGSIVQTTAEIVLVELSALRFSRELDADTGYRELIISASDSEK